MSAVKVDLTTEKLVTAVLAESKRLEQQGRFEEALKHLEQVMAETDNETIPSAVRVVKKVAALCNRLATSGAGEKQTVGYLRKAEQVLQNFSGRGNLAVADEGCCRLAILTHNNWAIYHKDRKSYHMALNYLMRAIRLTDSMGEILCPETLELCAKTKLSISALYSELRRYPEAVEFAEQCLATLQLELTLRLAGNRIEDLQYKEKAHFDSMIGTYIVAFYNIGAAEEAQNHYFNAVEAYKNAISFGKRRLTSVNHPVLALAEAALREIPQEAESHETEKQSSEQEGDGGALDEQLRETEAPPEVPLLIRSRSSILSHFSSHGRSESKVEFEENLPPIETNIEKGEQFKYYTSEQLVKLQERLSKGSGLNFVSADKYFYTKITKTLNVSQDVKFLRPLTAAGSTQAWHKDDEERRYISDLRLRKHPHKQTGVLVRGKEYVSQHIARLTEEFLATSKKNEIRMKSKMRNKEFRSAAQRMAAIVSKDPIESKPVVQYPLQRLFFKVEPTSPKPASIPDIPEPAIPPVQNKAQDFKVVKEEIETRMDELNDDLRKIEEAHRQPKQKVLRRSQPLQEQIAAGCELARSTQTDHQDERPKQHKVKATQEAIRDLTVIVDRKRNSQMTAPTKKKGPMTPVYPFLVRSQSSK